MRRIALIACLLGMWLPGCTLVTSEPIVTASATPMGAILREYDGPVERQIALGSSVEGRPLTLTVFGDAGPAVFIMAGIHGDESGSVDVARGLIAYLREHRALYADRRVGILPTANPDGLDRGSRANANRVDLNRNFPSRDWQSGGNRWMSHGSGPLSEPETRAVRAAMVILNPVRTVSIHSIGLGQYCNNYDGPGGEFAELMARLNGYPVRAQIGYPTPGSFGNWVGIDQQIPSVTLELPREQNGALCWTQNRDALLAFIQGTDGALARASIRDSRAPTEVVRQDAPYPGD